MSGGSFNYLCYNAPDEITHLAEQVDGMRESLAEHLPADSYAVGLTQRIAVGLRDYAALAEQLAKVWKAEEWYRSCDWAANDVEIAAETLRDEIESRAEVAP